MSQQDLPFLFFNLCIFRFVSLSYLYPIFVPLESGLRIPCFELTSHGCFFALINSLTSHLLQLGLSWKKRKRKKKKKTLGQTSP